jgi:hypothetical protein
MSETCCVIRSPVNKPATPEAIRSVLDEAADHIRTTGQEVPELVSA